MLTRFLRIAGAAVVSLLLLAWLYRGESASFHHLRPHSSLNDPFADPITPPAPASQPETKPDLVYYADPPDATPAQGDKKPHVPVKPASPSTVIDRKKTPYGYVLYATSDEYACAALITFARLLEFHTPHRLFALLTKAVSPEYKEAMERLNVTVTVMKPPAHPHPKLFGAAQQGDTKLENSLLRLMAFRIHQLQPDLARVLVIDADTFVYKTLDSLFSLPDVDVAAPRAYWKGKDVLSSKLLLITLSDRLWKSVEGAIKALGPDEYDGVVIDNLFGNTAMVLPGQYMVPNSHWVDWSIPDWYRPEADIHGHGMVQAYSDASLDDLWRLININVGTDDDNELKGSTKQKRNLLEEKDEKKVPSSEDDLGEILTPEEAAKELEEDIKLALKPPAESETEKKPDSPTNKLDGPVQTPEESEKKPDSSEKPTAESTDKPVQAQVEKVEKPQEDKPPTPTLAIPSTHKPSPPTPTAVVLPPPAPYDAETHPNREALFHVHDRVAILYYGAIVNPWAKHIQGLRDMKKEWHAAVYEQYKHWREHAQKHCPKVERQKQGAPEGEMEWYHLVNNV